MNSDSLSSTISSTNARGTKFGVLFFLSFFLLLVPYRFTIPSSHSIHCGHLLFGILQLARATCASDACNLMSTSYDEVDDRSSPCSICTLLDGGPKMLNTTGKKISPCKKPSSTNARYI